jgi:hypothetical protein
MFSLQGRISIRREGNGHLIWRKESSTLWTSMLFAQKTMRSID